MSKLKFGLIQIGLKVVRCHQKNSWFND